MTTIDAHIHYGDDDSAFLALLAELDLKLLNICVAASDAPRWRDQADAYSALRRAHPARFAWCTSFDVPGPNDDADYVERVIAGLQQDFASGAVACKIWKNIGMEARTAEGGFRMPDDPLFDPILDFITREGRTLLCHIAEPLECWQPLNPDGVHYSYYSAYPEWHMHNRSEFPSHARLMAARDHMVEKYPDLRVVGAHLGSLEWDVAEVAKRLDRYPNFAVDTSARLGDMAAQDSAVVRQFMCDYADRVLFGTDIVMRQRLADMPLDECESTLSRVRAVYRAYFDYFEQGGDVAIRGKQVRGLGLPANVLRRLYFDNARAWYPDT